MENKTILKVNNLQTEFSVGKKKVHAVNGVSFELKRGEILGIVGESGCGKSATAHSLLRLLPKNGNIIGGSIEYTYDNGETVELTEPESTSPRLRKIRGKEISMIFQDPLSSLNPVYTVGRQITEAILRHRKVTKAEAKEIAVDMLAKLGIPEPEKRFNEYPHQFSGGMKQRVMIAIAMVNSPAILIADEPTTALDVTIQAQILDLMKSLKENNGTSIIIITHNIGIVAEMCDKIAVMYMGRIVETGTAEEILTNPKHPYTKALLKSVPVLGMNSDRELYTIKGQTPDGSTEFIGCPFADRCDECKEICTKQMPNKVWFSDTHYAVCGLLGKNI